MAGKGERFIEAGHKVPKPFLPIDDKTMVERVAENVSPSATHRIIFISLEEHKGLMDSLIQKKFDPNQSSWVNLQATPTEGAACTSLLACDYINSDEPLIIANSDQLIDWHIDDFIQDAEKGKYDASMLIIRTYSKNYSYAQVIGLGEGREVMRTAEKESISPFGTVGIYWWKRGKDFVKSAKEMIEVNDRFAGEFYVCPTFNYLSRKMRIGAYQMHPDKCHFLGDPHSYNAYLKSTK